MSIQSEAVNTSSNLQLQPVEDILPLEFTEIEHEDVEGYLVSLTFDPDAAMPYQVRVNHEPVEDSDNLQQALRDLEFVKSELIAELRWGWP